MLSKHFLASLMISTVATFIFAAPTTAIDLSYNPELDAPLINEDTSVGEPQKANHSQLPGERLSENKTYTPAWISSDTTHSPNTTSKEGWNFKAPSVSSDKEPNITDERQSVKMSEQQRWKEKGKNYDDNPLNKDNYRINVEAEYTF